MKTFTKIIGLAIGILGMAMMFIPNWTIEVKDILGAILVMLSPCILKINITDEHTEKIERLERNIIKLNNEIKVLKKEW